MALDVFGARRDTVETLETVEDLCANSTVKICDPVMPVDPRTSVDAILTEGLERVECSSR